MLAKSVKVEGKLFVYHGKELGPDEIWICSFEGRSLFSLPDTSVEEFLQGIRKPPYITQYLVPDEDFDALRKERILALKTSVNYLPVFTESLWHIPLDIRVAGQSVSDFLKLFRLEQYEGLAGYGQVVARKISEILEKIAPDASDEFELEWRIKDVSHAFSSPLLKTVLQEIKTTLETDSILRNEFFSREKHLIQLGFELESFLIHQREALHELVGALLHIKEKEEWLSNLYNLALVAYTLYDSIIEPKGYIPSWPKLTLLLGALESSVSADSWMTFPKDRRFFAPFLLKCALEQIKAGYSEQELIEAIVDFEQSALNLSIDRLKGTASKNANPVVDSIQNAFYQNASVFSSPLKSSLSKDPRAVFDQSILALLPAFIENEPLLALDANSKLILTERGHQILNF